VCAFGPLTFEVLDAYLRCKYHGLLRFGGERGPMSEYLASVEALQQSVRATAIFRIGRGTAGERVSSGTLLTPEVLRRGGVLILDARLNVDDIAMSFAGLQRVSGNSALGDFHYVPVLFEAERHIHKFQRELLEVLGLFLGKVQGTQPHWGIIYHGRDCTMMRVRFSPDMRVANGIMRELVRLQRGELQPRLELNDHCPTCEFRERCRDQAVREDNISLLRGLGRKAITAYARKGILTLTQLAHTFRPRRRGKRSGQPSSKRYHALHALALRDRRVYVFGTPVVPAAEVRIYLDFEGIPDEGFVYLIGIIVCDGATQTKHSFWADNKEQERSMFEQFLTVAAGYEAARFFAYGGFERAFLKRLRQQTRRKKVVDKILDSLVNVLGIIYSHFYFPAYTNGLKDIGRLLGCTWTDENASGLQSILWRRWWETTGTKRGRRS
jgi:predicted RecB family nuclease